MVIPASLSEHSSRSSARVAAGYAGETSRELGLRQGMKVRFGEEDEKVTFVELIE